MSEWTEEILEPDDDEALWTPEPIVAYRGWTWDPVAGLLQGVYARWESSTYVATHGATHRAPGWNCRCGINAFKDSYMAARTDNDWPILGKIQLTGMVIEHERGYRGEIGEILELAIYDDYPYVVEGALSEKYGVPCTRERKIPWRK